MKSLAILLVTIISCLAEPSFYSPYSVGYHQTLLQPSPVLYSSPFYQKLVAPISPITPYAGIYSYPAAVPAAVATTVVDGIKSQYHTQDIHGQASYGHSEPGQTHTAVQDAHGNKVGSFSYVRPDGHVHKTEYVADAAGYRVASNDLPVGPVAPLVHHSLHKRSVYSHGIPVVTPSGHLADTPEVAAAKAAHLAEHAKRGNYYAGTHAAGAWQNGLYAPTWHGSYAAPVVTPDGYLADAPDVAAAKAAHFAEHAKRGNYHVGTAAHSSAWHGAYATPVVTPDGYLADAPDVAAAKAAHFAEHAKRGNYHAGGYAPSWHGGYATTVVRPDGYLADTPEVAAAKAAHLSEKAKISATSHYYNDIHSEHDGSHWYAPYAPVALTPSGHVADTPEVAHAKAAHLAEYAAIASRHKRSILGSWFQTPASTVPLHQPVAYTYAGPIAHPLAYTPYPIAKPLTHTTVVHGPHAISHTVL